MLVFVYCLNVFSAGAASFTDVAETASFSDAVSVLAGIEILKGYDEGGVSVFKPEQTITRAEFTAVVTRLLGLTDLSIVNMETNFTDVPKDEWYSGYVRIANDRNIIVGFGDGTFKPNEPVTYEQAIKMLVVAIGYEILAQETGGYPAGYTTVALDKGLLKGSIPGFGSTPASRGYVAQMVYNALEIPMAEASYSESGSNYRVSDKTLLRDYLRLNKTTGVVERNSVTSLSSTNTATTKEGHVEINCTSGDLDGANIFKNGSTDVKDALGKRIVVYYKNLDDELTILTYLGQKSTEEVTVPISKIKNLSNTSIKWEDENGSSNTSDLDIKYMIYNGSRVDFDASAIRNGSAGYIKLVDSNNTGSFDLVYVYIYRIIVAKTISSIDKRIYDEYVSTEYVVADSSNDSISLNITKDGQPISFSSIKATDILCIYESPSSSTKPILDIKVVSNKVSGTITERGSDEIAVDGKTYKLSYVAVRNLANDKIKMNVGDRGTFYLDIDGKIADVKYSAEVGAAYGYIVNAISSTGFDEIITIRLITTSGTSKDYVCAKKVNIDEVSRTGSDILSVLQTSAARTNKDTGNSNARYSQLIKYKLDNDGKLSYIDTNTKNSNEPSDTVTLANGIRVENNIYKSSNRKFDNEVLIDGSTKVFIVPSDRSLDTKYSIKTYSYFVNDKKYNFEAYDLTQVGTAGAIILYDNDQEEEVSILSPIFIVKEMSQVLDSELGAVQKVTGYRDGVLTTLLTQGKNTLVDKASGETILSGDVIRYGLTTSGKQCIKDGTVQRVLAIKKSAPAIANRIVVEQDATSSTSQYRTVYGTVYGKDSSNIKLVPSIKSDPTGIINDKGENYSASSTKVFLYDSSKPDDGVVTVDLNYLISYMDNEFDCSEVFAYIRDSNLRVIYILKRDR